MFTKFSKYVFNFEFFQHQLLFVGYLEFSNFQNEQLFLSIAETVLFQQKN